MTGIHHDEIWTIDHRVFHSFPWFFHRCHRYQLIGGLEHEFYFPIYIYGIIHQPWIIIDSYIVNHSLVGGLEHGWIMTFHYKYIGKFIIPADSIIFQRGRCTTSQVIPQRGPSQAHDLPRNVQPKRRLTGDKKCEVQQHVDNIYIYIHEQLVTTI